MYRHNNPAYSETLQSVYPDGIQGLLCALESSLGSENERELLANVTRGKWLVHLAHQIGCHFENPVVVVVCYKDKDGTLNIDKLYYSSNTLIQNYAVDELCYVYLVSTNTPGLFCSVKDVAVPKEAAVFEEKGLESDSEVHHMHMHACK